MIEEREVRVNEGMPGWVVPTVVVVGLLAVVGVVLGWRATIYSQDSRQAVMTELGTVKQATTQQVDTLQQRVAQAEKTNGDLESELTLVTKRLRITQGDLKKAREEAAQIREENAKELADMDTAVKGELATKASTDDVKAVSGEVTGVRTDLDSTKSDLKMARSELGTLIAKNHDEIDQLRRLGERDYLEFTLDKKGQPQKVGNVTVELRGTNPKKNQFSLAIVADDKRTEKRNRTVNEPIFFYMKGTKQPLELVINQVDKNKVTGYLSVPKAAAQTQTQATSGG